MRVIGAVPAIVGVDDFKQATHAQLDEAEDDTTLMAYLAAAQAVVERATNRPLGAREVEISAQLPGPVSRWWFPCAPVGAISKISYDVGDGAVDLGAESFRLRFAHDEPQIDFELGVFPYLAGQIEITVTATVGAADGDPSILTLTQAIKLVAREWYDAGISVGSEGSSGDLRLSFGARALIRSGIYKRPRVFARA
ncbi:uncharacterized phiE125 gp8 family phage protein [Rhodobacter sp. JA431]|uniref:hypothetical protein n=1 Tax=Rhodobacter sp. JA431 TaxID=570013 RepID=UPI000BC870D1|nr:hypothetical protein [Rhodobacter sp. JA431]SOC11434.1 uncharacterized phiE125 gp8 family phage protein [Rhodobacter sp. JA431]